MSSFINADREYKEGKVQNKLRPEDIEKITYVFRNKMELDKYSSLVSFEELGSEDYNFNIRRYVDNSPPATPHDVHAHLHGGIPEAEVNALQDYWHNYAGMRDQLFSPLKKGYLQFSAKLDQKEKVKTLFEENGAITRKQGQYTKALTDWWSRHLPYLEALPEKQNVYDLYHLFAGTISDELKHLGILDEFKSRGAFAAYWDAINTDLRSVATSGWNAELIPDEEILENQFPEVLKELRDNEDRRDELEALFKEVNELEEEAWNEEDYEVWPKDALAEIKEEIKEKGGELKEAQRELKNLEKRYKALRKAKESTREVMREIGVLKNRVSEFEGAKAELEKRIARHQELEAELRQCKKVIKEIKERQDELVTKAREKISPDEAKALILNRWERTLHTTINEYLSQYSRSLRAQIETLWDKYHTPLHSILGKRDEQSLLLSGFLEELGYEY
jgi:type I restriction enzyme M protein